MRCLHGTEGVWWIEWFKDLASDFNKHDDVAGWRYDTHYDYGQWKGHTSITSSEGDLTINKLIVQDDGRYTCLYITILNLHDIQTGAEYNLVIIGNANWW